MRIILGLLVALAGTSAQAVQVFACEPEWAALVKELGGDAVEVYTATTALQDVHQIQARPSLIARARSADLLICTGAELEVGWLPMVLRQASNGRIQPGKPGHLEVYTAVEMLDIPARVDRTAGDVHPYGNPHIQTDPNNIARIAPLITARLKAIEPARTATWERNLAASQVKWQAALTRWAEQARPLAGAEFVAHHKSWPYLEPKPGIPPPTGHLVSLLKQIEGAPVRGVIRSAYEDARPSEWLATRARLRAVVLPQTVGATPAARDLVTLYDAIIDELLALQP
jgi:zinc/manganese transport system substrate-binding protein